MLIVQANTFGVQMGSDTAIEWIFSIIAPNLCPFSMMAGRPLVSFGKELSPGLLAHGVIREQFLLGILELSLAAEGDQFVGYFLGVHAGWGMVHIGWTRAR